MAVSVTGPRAVNELGGPVIPGSGNNRYAKIMFVKMLCLQASSPRPLSGPF